MMHEVMLRILIEEVMLDAQSMIVKCGLIAIAVGFVYTVMIVTAILWRKK